MLGKLKDSRLFCSYTESGNLSFFPVYKITTAFVDFNVTFLFID